MVIRQDGRSPWKESTVLMLQVSEQGYLLHLSLEEPITDKWVASMGVSPLKTNKQKLAAFLGRQNEYIRL